MTASSPATARPAPVAVISTVRNEAATMRPLLDALASGTRLPDEVVVADAGSSDGTREILAARNGVVVLDVPGNRSQGRNAAIAAARTEVIASIDGGCLPDPEWLERITAPFARGAQWVGGFYRPGGSKRGVCIGLNMVFVLEEASRPGFIPSARSMAFTREVWSRVGGFPEHLEVSEDTAFDEALTAAGVPLVFVPDAIVTWHGPQNFRDQFRVLWSWSHSDGAAGIRGWAYRRSLLLAAGSGLLMVALGWRDLRLAPLGAIPLLGAMVRETRHKYRWATGWSRYLWIPLAWVVGLVARCGGFLVGRLRRGRSR